MTILEQFWEIRFVDFIPLILAVLSPILIYWIYRKLDKYKEKENLTPLFIRVKRMLENFLPEKETKDFFEAGLPFLRTQKENLIKIGAVIGDTGREKFPILSIVDKYIVAGAAIQVMGKKFEVNRDNINMILKEMREYSKKYYGFNFKEKDIAT